MTLNGVMAVTLRHLHVFRDPIFIVFSLYHKHCDRPTSCDAERRTVAELFASLLYFVVRVRCRRKESSRSLSHLLMNFSFPIRFIASMPLLQLTCHNNLALVIGVVRGILA